MSAAIATPLWHVPASSSDGCAVVGASRRQWCLRRNCVLTPAQLGAAYLGLCVLSLLIAAGFAWQGAPMVLGFAGIELLAVGVALLVHGRHVGDGDTVTLDGRTLRVEQRMGAQAHCTEFPIDWLSVAHTRDAGALIELAGRGRRVHVGRFLRAPQRAQFAQELRLALQAARASTPSAHPV